jgi:hypothetical protein
MKIPMPRSPNGNEAESNQASRVSGRLPTIVFKSIGCRTNQEELSGLAAALHCRGYRIVSTVDEATDIVIVNSCAVTAIAEAKTEYMLSTLAKSAPQARILVTGCLAQQNPERLAAFFMRPSMATSCASQTVPAGISRCYPPGEHGSALRSRRGAITNAPTVSCPRYADGRAAPLSGISL